MLNILLTKENDLETFCKAFMCGGAVFSCNVPAGFDGKVVEYKPEFDLYYNSTEGITIAGNKAELVVTGNLVQANKIAIPGVLVIASYTRAGQFVDAVFIPLYQDADITIPSTGLNTSGASKITAMLWTSADVPVPMCEAKSANL